MQQNTQSAAVEYRAACPHCDTELAWGALACPACGWLVHGEALKQLASRAEEHRETGKLEEARHAWEEALALLPASSQQHAVISERVRELEARHTAAQLEQPATPNERPKDGSQWKKTLATLAAVALLLGGKFKFLILGLTKAKTFVSMFAFFGLYWTTYGWMLALGLVLSIYIHEMGHVAMLRRLKISAGAPLFIPGVGALVLLKQRIHDPKTDAAVGLAGPVWGLGAGIAALAIYGVTDAKIWLAIAQLTGFINLFNLIPVWQLDGARGFHALSVQQRWVVVGTFLAMLFFTGQKLLIVVAAVAVWSAFKREAGPGDQRTLATFVVLIVALSLMSVLKAL
ncbi:MAG: site-2 protease family protein [Gemmatimonadaceae bacterium]